jgi:hypothetical protein
MESSGLPRFTDSYVVAVGSHPAFTVDDTHQALAALSDAGTSTVRLTLATELLSSLDHRSSPMALRLNDLRSIFTLQHGLGEKFNSTEYNDAMAAEADHDLPDSLLTAIIHDLREDASGIPDGHIVGTGLPQGPPVGSAPSDDASGTPFKGPTTEEQALPSYTRRRLKELSTWPAWKAAFFEQLDAHAKQGTFGEPCFPPPGATVLRPHWANVIKTCGRRKCRLCADGSKRAAPNLHKFAQTYSSCIEQPCQRLFFALAAADGLIVRGADCTNAYANAPPPTHETFLAIDDTYAEWYNERHPDKPITNRKLVVPVRKCLQGHPEAGALFEKHIVAILTGPGFNLRSTTHERNLYQGTFNGKRILVCRMVDDFRLCQ